MCVLPLFCVCDVVTYFYWLLFFSLFLYGRSITPLSAEASLSIMKPLPTLQNKTNETCRRFFCILSYSYMTDPVRVSVGGHSIPWTSNGIASTQEIYSTMLLQSTWVGEVTLRLEYYCANTSNPWCQSFMRGNLFHTSSHIWISFLQGRNQYL